HLHGHRRHGGDEFRTGHDPITSSCAYRDRGKTLRPPGPVWASPSRSSQASYPITSPGVSAFVQRAVDSASFPHCDGLEEYVTTRKDRLLRHEGDDMVSSKDVARLAGVSQSTVSRVLNNAPNVSPETRQKVLSAIEQLQYTPNLIARSLVTRSTKTIALISG